MSAAAVTPDAAAFWQSLQQQIDQLERNCIAEFQANAEFQNNRSLAPILNRLDALEAKIDQLTKNQPKGG